MKEKFAQDAKQHSIEEIHAITYADGVFECVYFSGPPAKEPNESQAKSDSVDKRIKQQFVEAIELQVFKEQPNLRAVVYIC